MKPLNDKDEFGVLCIVAYQEHGSFIIIQVVKKSKHPANGRLKNTKIGIFIQNVKKKQLENNFIPTAFTEMYKDIFYANIVVDRYRSPVSGSSATITFPLFSGRFAN